MGEVWEVLGGEGGGHDLGEGELGMAEEAQNRMVLGQKEGEGEGGGL